MTKAEAEIIIEREETLFEKTQKLDKTHGGQCVEFIQRYLESYYTHPNFRGVARNIVPNSQEPKVGSAVLTRESKDGHAALIVAIEGDELVLAESNFTEPEMVSVGRRIKITDERIVGYFNF